MQRADWYFDFISPFSYLQLELFDRLPADVTVTLKPDPVRRIAHATMVTRDRRRSPRSGASRIATVVDGATYGHIRCVSGCASIQPDQATAARDRTALQARRRPAIFRYVWRDGHLPDDAGSFAALTDMLHVADVERQIDAQPVKDQLRSNGAEAIARGVFGVPTFAIERIFSGADATQFVIDQFAESDAAARSGNAARQSAPIASARK
jgi:2-hydroxychromene-2-carboxylate isomerase